MASNTWAVTREMPGAIGDTFMSGEAADSVVGSGAGDYDHLVGAPLTSVTGRNWMSDAGPLYGYNEASRNGRTIGNVARASAH